MSRPTIHFGSSLPVPVLIVGGFALVLVLVVGCCTALNALTRRRVLNGWLWGGMVIVFLVAYHLIALYTANRDASVEMRPEPAGEAVGTSIGLSLLLAVAAWRALAWRRRRPAV